MYTERSSSVCSVAGWQLAHQCFHLPMGIRHLQICFASNFSYVFYPPLFFSFQFLIIFFLVFRLAKQTRIHGKRAVASKCFNITGPFISSSVLVGSFLPSLFFSRNRRRRRCRCLHSFFSHAQHTIFVYLHLLFFCCSALCTGCCTCATTGFSLCI